MENWDAQEPLTAALEYRQGKGTERTRISLVVRSGSASVGSTSQLHPTAMSDKKHQNEQTSEQIRILDQAKFLYLGESY